MQSNHGLKPYKKERNIIKLWLEKSNKMENSDLTRRSTTNKFQWTWRLNYWEDELNLVRLSTVVLQDATGNSILFECRIFDK